MILKNDVKNREFANFLQQMTACFGNLSQFEQNIQQIAEVVHIALANYQLDHIAVRMNSLSVAEQWRNFLLQRGVLLKESMVNGRQIGLFQLSYPLDFLGQKIDVLELPFPKGKVYSNEGWEHIEMVFPMEVGESAECWIERTLKWFDLRENNEIIFKISQPQVAGEQLANPSIAITLRNQNYCKNSCLKIHPYDIKAIISS